MAPWVLHPPLCLYRCMNLLHFSHISIGKYFATNLSVWNAFSLKFYRPRNVACYSQLTGDQNAGTKPANDKTKRPKSESGTKITLLEPNGNIQVTYLEEAEKVARRRNLKLVKLVDNQANTLKPLYKMMTTAQYFEEDLESRKLKKEKKQTEVKGEKILTISDKIGDHDLQSKIKNVLKWLSKRHEVRIAISETDSDLSEKVFKAIESSTKQNGKLVQKRNKGKEIKFSILPVSTKIEEGVVDSKSETTIEK